MYHRRERTTEDSHVDFLNLIVDVLYTRMFVEWMNADFQMILMFNYLCTIMLCTVGLYTGHAKTPDLVQPHPHMRNTQCIHQQLQRLIILKSPIFTPGHTGVTVTGTTRADLICQQSIMPETIARSVFYTQSHYTGHEPMSYDEP